MQNARDNCPSQKERAKHQNAGAGQADLARVAGPTFLSTCEGGAAGNETQARACFARWDAALPVLAAEVAELKRVLWDRFPNADPAGAPFSGSYKNEADYFDDDWQRSFWGALPQIRRVF